LKIKLILLLIIICITYSCTKNIPEPEKSEHSFHYFYELYSDWFPEYPNRDELHKLENWNRISFSIWQTLGTDYIYDLKHNHILLINNRALLDIELKIYPGKYEYFKNRNLDELKINIQQYLPNYDYRIRINKVYPFLIIFNKKIEDSNMDDMEEMIMKINSELPFASGIDLLFNYVASGTITEFDGNPIDFEQIRKVFTKYFGRNYILDM
jgi:hypothetical protein